MLGMRGRVEEGIAAARANLALVIGSDSESSFPAWLWDGASDGWQLHAPPSPRVSPLAHP